MYIYPYNMVSESVRNLAKALDAKVIRTENSKFKGSPDKIVINWGNSVNNEEIEKCFLLNKPEAVKRAKDKLVFFNLVQDKISIPPFTTDTSVALSWIQNGGTVLGRTTLTGHSGEGIVIFDDPISFEDYNHKNIKMYVQYIPKKDEYRIHVFHGEAIDIQQKLLRKGLKQTEFRIRNHHNGFIYARENIVKPDPQVIEEAIKSVELCELDFGAVDVIWNNYRNKAYVLEINTAPGIENTTVDTYVKATNNWVIIDDVNNAPRFRLRDNPLIQNNPLDNIINDHLERIEGRNREVVVNPFINPVDRWLRMNQLPEAQEPPLPPVDPEGLV